jgi:hypothetical protein
MVAAAVAALGAVWVATSSQSAAMADLLLGERIDPAT